MGYHRLQLRCELNRHTCHTCFRDMGSQESCAEIYPRTVHWNCTSKWEVSHISMGQNQLYRIFEPIFSVSRRGTRVLTNSHIPPGFVFVIVL